MIANWTIEQVLNDHAVELNRAFREAFPEFVFTPWDQDAGHPACYAFPLLGITAKDMDDHIKTILRYFKEGGFDGKPMAGDDPEARCLKKNKDDIIYIIDWSHMCSADYPVINQESGGAVTDYSKGSAVVHIFGAQMA